jgi:hypothetical protein
MVALATPAKTVVPAMAALPVVVSTSHGTATVMMTLPVMETVLPRTSSVSALSRGDGVALEPRPSPEAACRAGPELVSRAVMTAGTARATEGTPTGRRTRPMSARPRGGVVR